MVIKKISKAFEDGFYLGVNILNKLTKLTNIPDVLLKEANSFMKRNSLAVVACNVHNKEPVYECCPSCLEAHLIRKANQLGLEKEKKEILKIFEFKIGHEGYYLDKEEVIKID